MSKHRPEHRPEHHEDELPSIDVAALQCVTGGAGADMSSMLPMMMMMRKRGSAPAPAPAPPPQPVQPKILLNGVEQPASALTSNGTSFEAKV